MKDKKYCTCYGPDPVSGIKDGKDLDWCTICNKEMDYNELRDRPIDWDDVGKNKKYCLCYNPKSISGIGTGGVELDWCTSCDREIDWDLWEANTCPPKIKVYCLFCEHYSNHINFDYCTHKDNTYVENKCYRSPEVRYKKLPEELNKYNSCKNYVAKDGRGIRDEEW